MTIPHPKPPSSPEGENMIERVARAMYAASRVKHIGPDYGFPNAYDLRMARAAIAAMREPTEAMKATEGPESCPDFPCIYRAFIDAALSEGK